MSANKLLVKNVLAQFVTLTIAGKISIFQAHAPSRFLPVVVHFSGPVLSF